VASADVGFRPAPIYRHWAIMARIFTSTMGQSFHKAVRPSSAEEDVASSFV